MKNDNSSSEVSPSWIKYYLQAILIVVLMAVVLAGSIWGWQKVKHTFIEPAIGQYICNSNNTEEV